MAEELPDRKNVKVFKHVKDGPEVALHKSRWDRKKCKRNKGGQHEMQLIKDKPVTSYDYRAYRIPGFKVWERRPFEWRDREWRCTHCNKKEVDGWPYRRAGNSYTGDWEEWRRVEDKGHGK